MLNVSEQNFGQIAVLRCSGRLVLGKEISLLQKAIISQSSKRIVVLDLAGIDAIDGSGVGLLVFLHAWTRANHMEMKLMNRRLAAPHCRELAELRELYIGLKACPQAIADSQLPDCRDSGEIAKVPRMATSLGRPSPSSDSSQPRSGWC